MKKYILSLCALWTAAYAAMPSITAPQWEAFFKTQAHKDFTHFYNAFWQEHNPSSCNLCVSQQRTAWESFEKTPEYIHFESFRNQFLSDNKHNVNGLMKTDEHRRFRNAASAVFNIPSCVQCAKDEAPLAQKFYHTPEFKAYEKARKKFFKQGNPQ